MNQNISFLIYPVNWPGHSTHVPKFSTKSIKRYINYEEIFKFDLLAIGTSQFN